MHFAKQQMRTVQVLLVRLQAVLLPVHKALAGAEGD